MATRLGHQVIADLGYAYDRAGNRTQETRHEESRRDAYTYDSAYRIASASDGRPTRLCLKTDREWLAKGSRLEARRRAPCGFVNPLGDRGRGIGSRDRARRRETLRTGPSGGASASPLAVLAEAFSFDLVGKYKGPTGMFLPWSEFGR